ncbi:MAG: hypothetical protein RBQ91_01810 [Acholeplasma sp.]|nr:hypothetical protein [Acholeplasma sp.]
MISKLVLKKHIRSSLKKTLVSYTYILVFLILFLTYLLASSMIKTNKTNETLFEKDLIAIHGDTSRITEYNLYLKLLDKGINVIPIVSDEITLFNQRVRIIGTSEAYLNYLISDKGVYEQTELLVENELMAKNVYTNTQMNGLVIDGILTIGQENFTVVDSLEFGSIPTVVMDYQAYSLFQKDISLELADGGFVYNFDSLYVIQKNASDFNYISDLFESIEKKAHFDITTHDSIIEQKIDATGINSTLVINLLWILGILMIAIMSMIIIVSINGRLEEFKLRFILGHPKKDLITETAIENGFMMSILLGVSFMISSIFILVYNITHHTPLMTDALGFISLFTLPLICCMILSTVISFMRLSTKKLTKRRLT